PQRRRTNRLPRPQESRSACSHHALSFRESRVGDSVRADWFSWWRLLIVSEFGSRKSPVFGSAFPTIAIDTGRLVESIAWPQCASREESRRSPLEWADRMIRRITFMKH